MVNIDSTVISFHLSNLTVEINCSAEWGLAFQRETASWGKVKQRKLHGVLKQKNEIRLEQIKHYIVLSTPYGINSG